MILTIKNSTAKLLATGFALAALTAAPFAAFATDDADQETIDYRQHAMKTMGEQVAAMGLMAQGKIPPDNFALHAQILAIAASTAKFAFTPKIAGGEAKPDVWAKWDDFSKRLDALTAATADLAATAKSGGMAAAAPKMQAALSCKGCHDLYREAKK
jgi:cytochrome c556